MYVTKYCLGYFVFLPSIEISMKQAVIRKKNLESTLASNHADSNKCSNFPDHSYIYTHQHPPLSIARKVFHQSLEKKLSNCLCLYTHFPFWKAFYLFCLIPPPFF